MSLQRHLKEVMSDLGMTEGFDVGLEMSGVPSAFQRNAGQKLNHGGKTSDVLGIPPSETCQLIGTKLFLKGLVIKGVYGREMYRNLV